MILSDKIFNLNLCMISDNFILDNIFFSFNYRNNEFENLFFKERY